MFELTQLSYEKIVMWTAFLAGKISADPPACAILNLKEVDARCLFSATKQFSSESTVMRHARSGSTFGTYPCVPQNRSDRCNQQAQGPRYAYHPLSRSTADRPRLQQFRSLKSSARHAGFSDTAAKPVPNPGSTVRGSGIGAYGRPEGVFRRDRR